MTTDNIIYRTLLMDLKSFDGFEIHGVRNLYESSTSQEPYACEQCDDQDADFFSLYGHYDPADFNNGVPHAQAGLVCLLDFPTRDEAELASAYFSAYRQLMLDVQKLCNRYNELLDDENASTAPHVLEGLMEDVERLETSLAWADSHRHLASPLHAKPAKGQSP